MLLCDLPADILAIVLGKCVVATSNAVDDFKRNLPLLAVCRLWRRLAAPLVYNCVLVQYGEGPRCEPSLFARNPSAAPANVAVRTNLDLITMVGCASAVKRVQVHVYCEGNPFPGWREVIGRIRAVASVWRVAELTVAMRLQSSLYISHNMATTKHTDDIAEVVDAVAELFPFVRRLECEGDRTPLTLMLHGRLASQYADRLTWLIKGQPRAMLPGCQFTRLKRFKFCDYSDRDYQLPRIASGELVDMDLGHVPANHSWAPFSTNSDSREIEFPKLKMLSVWYGTTYLEDGVAVRHRDGHPWRLHFPSLAGLFIDNTEEICPLLEYAALPPRMMSISIAMRSSAFRDIANVVLPATKLISLRIRGDSGGDASGLPAVNRVLESARGSETVALEINDSSLHVGPESITCTALTNLVVDAIAPVDTLFAILQRLPNLVSLELSNLDLREGRTDISVPAADDDVIVAPLHMSLREIEIGYRPIEDYLFATAGVHLVSHLLLGIPTLTSLSADQTPARAVHRLVAEYAPRYPHLDDVELNLDEDAD